MRKTELLAYQKAICNDQYMYPASAWLKYGSAFQIDTARNKALKQTFCGQ